MSALKGRLPKDGQTRDERLYIRISEEKKNWIKSEADKRNKSIADLVIEAVEKYVEKEGE